jgi:Bacterial regulatory proteins, luxR family
MGEAKGPPGRNGGRSGAIEAVSDLGRRKSRREYRPAVEALEALRLFDAAPALLPGVAVEQGALPVPLEPVAGPWGDDAWDDALAQPGLVALRDRIVDEADAEAIGAGLEQLGRYLCRAWYRAGIPLQQHDDCTQAVYATLLTNLGRPVFDRLLTEVGRLDIREVFRRETAQGPDFFRAIDMVKKQAQRQRRFEPLDGADVPDGRAARPGWRETLEEAIAQALDAREAAVIHDTLDGLTPMEIGQQMGLAPKTVSNIKTLACQKLREFLVADLVD